MSCPAAGRDCRASGFIPAAAELRSRGIHVPILFISANNSTDCRLQAFRSGADDFIAHPCHPEELILRIKAVLRRCFARPLDFQCQIGSTTVDLASGEAVCGHRRQRLTAKEAHLFRYLWSRRDQVVSRAELLRDVWEYTACDTRTVDVHIAMLRRKLEAEPHRPQHLVTLRARGYLLRCM